MSPSPEDTGGAKMRWNERASRYDRWYGTFKGAVEHRVDWELLRRHLPESQDATILDAAGGTGRLTLPLAELGYSVTLCDISPGMLAAARSKLEEHGLSARVPVLECDVAELPLADWDPRLFEQTTQALTLLATEPSVRGAARHLTAYGRKS